MGACMLKDPKNKGYKNTLDFCSIDLKPETKKTGQNLSTPVVIPKSTPSSKKKLENNRTYETEGDILDDLKRNKNFKKVETKNISTGSQNKSVVSTSTRT